MVLGFPTRGAVHVLLVSVAVVFMGGGAAAADLAPTIAWEKDFKAAMRRAQASGRPLLVDFWAEWCDWCHKLDATTYRDPAVIEMARAFVAVKVNTEGSLGEAELAARYGGDTLPTIGFVSPGGRLFSRRTVYEGPEQFSLTLQEAGRLGAEVIALESRLARDPKDAAALGGLGALLAERGLYEESVEPLRDARKTDRARPSSERKRTRLALARVEQARGKRAEAERLLEEALALSPADPVEDQAALVSLGDIDRERGEIQKASAAWRRAIETLPDGALAGRAREALAALDKP